MGGYAIIDCENVESGVNAEFANSVKEAFSLNKPIVLYNLSFTNSSGAFKLKPTFVTAYVIDGTYVMELYITESENSNVVISVEGNEVTITAEDSTEGNEDSTEGNEENTEGNEETTTE